MNEILILALACAAGGALGPFFFGGLWLTVSRGVDSTQPALWFAGSMILRMGITVAGIYYVSGGLLGRLTMCMLGFAIARYAVIWLTLPPPTAATNKAKSGKEATHAP
jgi:F1F0 ATPase subunit 2